jgi:hypothetical protein
MSFFYALNQIKKYDVEKKRTMLKEIIEAKNIYEEKILSLQVLFTSSYLVYSKENRDEIKKIVDALIDEFRDSRSTMLKDSLKKDLPSTIIKFCERELASIKEADAVIAQIQEDIDKSDLKSIIRKKGLELSNRIHPLRDEYIRDSNSINEGIREWDCLISLVEDGTITESQLIDYGIDLENIKASN